jgi:hypothetical protein
MRNTKPPASDTCSGTILSGCSIFTVSKGDQVFFGGNDDGFTSDSYYWVDPGDGKNYGAIWIGTPDNVQQGVNEKGLAYDANGLPRLDVNPHLERAPVSGGYSSYPIQILHECASVEEVIRWVNTHQWHSYMHDQLHFADATGEAVVISAGADGEVAFTRKPPGDSFLVSTNFNVANPGNGDYPCWRYQTATQQLEKLLDQAGELTSQDVASVLDAVYGESGTGWTVESMVADLPNGVVYLYYFYQFDQPVVLNVAEEIAKARAGEPLSNLFPEDVKREATRRYQYIQSQRIRYEVLGKVWLGLVVASLGILLISSTKGRKGLTFWIPVVVILGPLGLLVWLVAGRQEAGRTRLAGDWQAILVEASGDVTPTIVAFVVAAVGLVQFPEASNSQLLQLLIFFISPLLTRLFLFQAPLLASVTRNGYWRTLLQRLPHAWATANLGMAATFALATPLMNKSL